MTEYILKIVGVALITVIIDLILPTGKMEKIVKIAMGIIIIFVIVSPIPSFISKVKNYSLDESESLIDMDYVKKINMQKIDALETKIENELKSYGISNIEIELICDLSKTEISYLFANIDAKSVVLEGSAKNINLTEKVQEVVLKFVNIKKENILVYE